MNYLFYLLTPLTETTVIVHLSAYSCICINENQGYYGKLKLK